MATSPAPDHAPPPAPPPPRYRGLAGAVAYALMLTVLGLILGLLAGLVLWLGTRAGDLAFQLASRTALICVAAGIAAGVSRFICGGESDRLLTLRFVKGEVSGLLGFLAALVLVGLLTDQRVGLGDRSGLAPADQSASGRFERAFVKAPGTKAVPPPVNPLQWWFAGVIGSPWWLLLGCCIGAAAVFALVEAGLRRVLRRRAPDKPC